MSRQALCRRLTPIGDGIEQRGGHGGELVELVVGPVVGPGHSIACGAPERSITANTGAPHELQERARWRPSFAPPRTRA